MSTQSIIHNTIEDLDNNADKVIISMAEKYLLKTKFGIGGDFNKVDFKKICWMKRILCEERCKLLNSVEKIKEKMNLLTIKYN